MITIVFSSITNLKFLSQIDTILVDGTFKTCPKLFIQFFTIHGLSNENYIPLIFFLLINKNVETYKKAFLYSEFRIYKIWYTFFNENVICWFRKKTIHSTLLFIWPSVELKEW